MQQRYLNLMGIDVWTRRGIVQESAALDVAAPASSQENPAALQANSDLATPTGELSWQALEARVAQCAACGLQTQRKQTVFGVGHQQADLLIVGEAPGAREDALGEPFVGRAGLLLDQMLRAMKLSRSEVYIANILKCRPPQNRDPKLEEIIHCTPFLQRQIALLQPKVMLAVGRIAAHYLLDSADSLGKMRGQVYRYGESQVPLVVSYHPAYLLRSPEAKAKAWQDLLRVKALLSS